MLTISVFVAFQFERAKVARDARESAIQNAVEAVQAMLRPAWPDVRIEYQTFDLRPVKQIFEQIREMIDRSNVFVADISEKNANVIFELGYAFGVSTSKARSLVILTHEDIEISDLPSDLSGMFFIRYRTADFEDVLQRQLYRAASAYLEAVRAGELEEFGLRSFWRYSDGQEVDIVCSELPPGERPPYADPSDRNYLRYGCFADLDSLVHIRSNLPKLFPHMRMRDFPASEHRSSEHNGLIVLGGPAWNQKFKAWQEDLPLRFEDRPEEKDDVLVVSGPSGKREFRPRENRSGVIVSDISVVCRMSDVSGRTTFLFAGSLTFGVLGACKVFLNKACGLANSRIIGELVGDDDFVCVFETQYREHEVFPPRFDVRKPFYIFRRRRNHGGEFECLQEPS